MKKLWLILCLLSGFICFPSSYAQPDAWKALEQQLSRTQRITAEFKQTVKESQQILQESYGKMAIERPGKFRWEIERPFRQLIVTDGVTLWIYDPDLRQVTLRSFDAGLQATPMVLLTSNQLQIRKHFRVKALWDLRGEGFELRPKAAGAPFESILLFFKNNRLIRMECWADRDQVTELEFFNLQLNPDRSAFPKTLFFFKIPKGVEVVGSR